MLSREMNFLTAIHQTLFLHNQELDEEVINIQRSKQFIHRYFWNMISVGKYSQSIKEVFKNILRNQKDKATG